jgi:hypothetical protein
MLSPQEDAWAVYAAFFLFFTIILTLRCRYNLLLIPFSVFGMLITIGNICLLATGASLTEAIIIAEQTASSLNQEFSIDHYWISKSLVLNVFPAASVLVFLGIMEAQLVYIRHIAAAIYNRDHWGSLYLRDPEKKKPTPKASLRPWTYWTCLVLLAVYTIIAVCSVIVLTTSFNRDIGVAICVSLLCCLAWGNTALVMWYTSTTHHARMIRQNRGDVLFLRFTPILFSICMVGMTALSWMYCFVALNLTLWIILESVLVYLPLVVIMIMCIYTGKIKKMGRQYRVETEQRSFNSSYSYKSVSKKISEVETKQMTTPDVNNSNKVSPV